MTALEIAALMGEVLDIDDVEASDNFFEIGGNSILALFLIEELGKRCQVKISLLNVIRSPTPEGLASLIARDEVSKAR